LGTGVGLGVVCSGRIMMGSRGLIEGGHMIVEPGPNARPCPCGQRGCLEAYASAPAVAAIASERMQRGDTVSASDESSVDAYFGGDVITAEEVFARANRGDEVAIGVVEETCDYLGLACLNICRVLDPAAILLTGELSRAEGLVEKVREAFLNREWKLLPHECKIDLSSACKPSSSGVVGAACAALSDCVRRDHSASRKSINRGKGRYPLSTEANNGAGEILSEKVNEKDTNREPKGRGNSDV
ncbi:unnamed protein product, partial [Ascophyllum nodosum]